MKKTLDAVNELLSSVFYDIIKIEERFLKHSEFKDISIKEVRTIESIHLSNFGSMSYIAKKLHITVGTLTVSINNLEKKGYVKRQKSNKDKRVVTITLTQKGMELFKLHQDFRKKILRQLILELSIQEKELLDSALGSVRKILSQQYLE